MNVPARLQRTRRKLSYDRVEQERILRFWKISGFFPESESGRVILFEQLIHFRRWHLLCYFSLFMTPFVHEKQWTGKFTFPTSGWFVMLSGAEKKP
jgi:hypothetical protein